MLVAAGRTQEALAHLEVAGGCWRQHAGGAAGLACGLAWHGASWHGHRRCNQQCQRRCVRHGMRHETCSRNPALAAGHIFAAQLLPPGQAADKGLRQGTVLDAGGNRGISKAEAAEAAVAAYRHALLAVEQLSTRPGVAVDPAAKKQVVCRLRQQACAVLQAQQAPALAHCLAELQQAGCAVEGGSGGGGGAPPRAQEQPAGTREEL